MSAKSSFHSYTMELLRVMESVFIFLSMWSTLNAFSEAIWWHFTDPANSGLSMKAMAIFLLAISIPCFLVCVKRIRRLHLEAIPTFFISTTPSLFLFIVSLPLLGGSPWARTLLLTAGVALSPPICVWVLANPSKRFSGKKTRNHSREDEDILRRSSGFSSSDVERCSEGTTHYSSSSIFLHSLASEFLIAILLSMSLRWCAVTINVMYETWYVSFVLLILVSIASILRLLIYKLQIPESWEDSYSGKSNISTATSAHCHEYTEEANTTYTSHLNYAVCSNNSIPLHLQSTSLSQSAISHSQEEEKLYTESKGTSKTPSASKCKEESFCCNKEMFLFVLCSAIQGSALGVFLTLFQWIFSTPNMICRWSGVNPDDYGIVILTCFGLGVILSLWQPHRAVVSKLRQHQQRSGLKVYTALFVILLVILLTAPIVLRFSSEGSDFPFMGSCLFSVLLPYCLYLNIRSISFHNPSASSPRAPCDFVSHLPAVFSVFTAISYVIFYVCFLCFINPQLTSVLLGRMDVILLFQIIIIALSLAAQAFMECHSNASSEGHQEISSCSSKSLSEWLWKILRNSSRSVILTLLAFSVLLVGLLVGPRFFPNHCLSQHLESHSQVSNLNMSKNSSILSVMSWNILFGHDIYGRDNLPCLGQVIDHVQPDFVGLQESDSLPMYWGGKDVLFYLSGYLGGSFESYLGVNPLFSSLGVGILSKLTVSTHKSSILPKGKCRKLPHYSITQIDGKIGNKTVRILNVHAVFKNWTATEINQSPFANVSTSHMEYIADQVKDLEPTDPSIIMGDFNLNPNESQLDIFYKNLGYKSALHQDRLLTPPSTLQNRFAIVDHIFYRGLNLVKSKTLKETGDMSDHNPILAYFEVPR